MRFQLVRPGQTPSNVAGQLDTAFPGASLTPRGHRQARALPQVFGRGQVQAIDASTLNRTQLTAKPLSESTGTPVHVLDGLEEISAGKLDTLADEASQLAIENTGGCLLERGVGGQWSVDRWDTEPLGGSFVREVLDQDVTGGEDDAA